MNRKSLPKKLEKEIYQQFESRCPFCDESDINTLQVHHIIPHAEIQDHHAENLLLTCANCHQKIENGIIEPHKVNEAKSKAKAAIVTKPDRTPKVANNVLSFYGINRGVVLNTVNISAKPGSVRQNPIASSIGAELEQRNYAKYLIDRYHEFKKAEVGKDAMNYSVFYNSIKQKFGAKWDHIPVEAFEELVVFLKGRIDGTRLGKTQKAQGKKNYSSFEEHCAKAMRGVD